MRFATVIVWRSSEMASSKRWRRLRVDAELRPALIYLSRGHRDRLGRLRHDVHGLRRVAQEGRRREGLRLGGLAPVREPLPRPRRGRHAGEGRLSVGVSAAVSPLVQTPLSFFPSTPRVLTVCNWCYATSSRARTWPGASPRPEATTPAVRLRKSRSRSRSRSRSHLARRRDRRGGVTGPAGATS